MLVSALALACSASPPPAEVDPFAADARCRFGADPVVVKRDGDAQLLRWDLPRRPVFAQEVLPVSQELAVFRRAFLGLPREQWSRPVGDAPRIDKEHVREVWRREFINRDVASSGKAGELRPIRCLEALFFDYHNARRPQLRQSSEFIVALLGRDTERGYALRAYYGDSATDAFPPKSVYPFDAAALDIKAGWRFVTMLHNHTVLSYRGRPALGWPAPSTQDVLLSRALVDSLGLESIQVTNGFYTVEIPASALSEYQGPP